MTLPAEAQQYIDEWLGAGCTAYPLAGDASVRAYYRISAADGRTYIFCWYPEDVRQQLPRVLRAHAAVAPSASVPAIVKSGEAAMLLEDAGDRTLFDLLHADRDEGVRWYRKAIEALAAFQKSEDPGLSPPFTADSFYAELEMAREYYVEKLMERDGAALREPMRSICDKISLHPYVLCHRDYHGQNIHILTSELYIIDFQDLRQGPDTYDLASLLRDRGVADVLGPAEELDLLRYYGRLTSARGDLRRRYFEVLLQRSIKILGTFARQPIARGRMHYLDFIPSALESIRLCLDELPDFEALRDIFPLQFSKAAALARARELNAR